jgi:hypothetical protein
MLQKMEKIKKYIVLNVHYLLYNVSYFIIFM